MQEVSLPHAFEIVKDMKVEGRIIGLCISPDVHPNLGSMVKKDNGIFNVLMRLINN